MAPEKNAMKFKTRIYKHELRFSPTVERSIINYTDELWERLMERIAAHGFTGVVFYAGYHPFEYFLNYKEMPGVADQPEEYRDVVRKQLQRGLAIAHKHGLTTFIQHYVGHFTKALTEKYDIKVQGRLSGVDHPEVNRYIRYCYRETFRELPDLDGLYFNFESAHNAWKHVIKTAIAEFSVMAHKPIMVYRLWDFTDMEGMRKLMDAYKGRVILGHKISDTNDVYYLPCADSRVMEWKKRLKRPIEWMFLVGPCHNCATNLCDQLWGDYDFVQAILDDARRKGADSFSFNTSNEFFSPDMPSDVTVFSEHEKAMARFNLMHLEGALDYAKGVKKTRAQRSAALAKRVGVDEKCGQALLSAVEASSQLTLLSYQQFCLSSAREGYRNCGDHNHIQDPFMINPATELGHQAKRPTWGKYRQHIPWVVKTIDTPVGPDNFLQYIIDFVDPKKRKATRNPKVVADLLKKNMAVAESSLRQYRRLAGTKATAKLEPYIRQNAVVGEIMRREILSAINLYSIYFANSKSSVLTKLKAGLKELKALQAIIDKLDKPALKIANRVFLLKKGPDYKMEIGFAEKALAKISRTNFPFQAYSAYMESRRLFNEIRRNIRPGRSYDRAAIEQAVDLLEKSMAKAMESAAILRKAGETTLADNVHIWLDYLAMELAFTKPPTVIIGKQPTGKFEVMRRHHSFRAGEVFTEDFLGFFEPADYRRDSGLSFQTWRTDDSLVIQIREEGVDMAAQLALWDKNKQDTLSCSHITRIMISPDGSYEKKKDFVVWPQGKGVSLDKIPDVGAEVQFSHDATSWQTTATIPFDLIGRRPKKGESWKLNVTANPSITGTSDYTWSPQYDGTSNKLLGTVRFE